MTRGPSEEKPENRSHEYLLSEAHEKNMRDVITDDCVDDDQCLLHYGVVRVPLPPQLDCAYWAETLSQTTPMILAGEGEGEYAFYRNILDEPDFPFAMLLEYFAATLQTYFHGSSAHENRGDHGQHDNGSVDENVDENEKSKDHSLDVRLDDAFCVHYNMTQEDTSGAKHTDPSDITVNMCLSTSDDMKGSLVKFYGTESLEEVSPEIVTSEVQNGITDYCGDGNDVDTTSTTPKRVRTFLVRQEQGCATLHWGHHPHETTPLVAGERTNIILTYCFNDPAKSNAANRSCYFPS